MIKKENIVGLWLSSNVKNIDWNLDKHPGAPSSETTLIYKKFIEEVINKKHIKNPKVLVHGATPHLRDMLFEINAKIVILDISLNMILSMTKLLKHKNDEEIIVNANWINTPLQDDYFDFVIGDLTLPNIPKNELDNYFNSIKRVLKKEGYWITRIACNDFLDDNITFQSIFDNYYKIPVEYQRMAELTSMLMRRSWDCKKEICSMAKINTWMKKYEVSRGIYNHSNSIAKKRLQELWNYWNPMNKEWQFYTMKKTKKFISEFFDIEKQKSPNNCYYHIIDELYPVIKCKVKK